MNYGFIGAGNMATSLIGGLIQSGTSAQQIKIVDVDKNACARLHAKFGVISASLDEIGDSTVVVIAVKPHIVEAVCSDLAAVTFIAAPVFISVAAGVREKSMRKWLTDGAAIVRCMPNTPALLGLGSTGLLANEHCSAKQRADAESLLQAAGITVWVEQEAQLDAVTAVSGSGPAYFFYLIEHMIEAGVTLGLDKSTASDLAIETAFGAASMARAREHSPATLRENVTSKNGTTAAALEAFAAADTPAIIARAMQAANDRAVSMGDDYGDD